ncbi:uncharacterized protein LOC123686485 [Harmonia axyridis]|uniref:uncharacterized protein LOC123686485 n=1 Tax=Harmonia axyridis TaxID=115357 RepID=UPI001E2787BF|nr:uncharacterized protein LOC123686485 [Harmonia axyridis]
MREIVLFFLFCVFNSALTQNSNPFRDPNICGRPACIKDEGKFKYGPSSQQTYDYTVDVRSLFNGTSRNESTLSIKSTVILEFLTPCEGLLTLRDLKLREGGTNHRQTDEFSSAVSAFSLRFSFYDGVITELCPNTNEKIWILNLKRGILSMIQNSMKRFDLDTDDIEEEDVKGKCKTKYLVVGSEKTSLIIEKVKDLSSCTSRSRLHSAIQSVPYGFRSKIQPEESLLESSSRCVLSIDHHIYNSVKCTESYLMKPFSNRGSGVTTVVKQNLILLEEKNITALTKQEEITKRVPIFFDHTPSLGLVDDNVKNAKNLILKMCKMDTDDDHIQFSDIFTDLVDSLRLLTPQALKEIFDHSGILCNTGKKNVIDALPYVETTGAFAIMKDMIIKKQVRPSTTNDWMFYVSLTKHPDEEMMEIAADLLERSSFDPSIVLSIGALTHTFCEKTPNCNDYNGVQQISEHFEKSVRNLYNKEINVRENREKMIVYLKALGNTGQLSSSLKELLVELIEDNSLDMELKIAAVECHRRVPCDESKDYFEDLYRNYEQDSELRIAAYLQIMRCPNYLMMRTIRNTLEQEEVNQVGSFVWSHLKNLLKSAVPSRVEIQGLLSDKDLVRKFSSDLRKFSHNYEGSLFFEEYNIGGNYDSNLIFSTKSYVPSSASFNFTVDLFGESINMFEVTARVQGFENYFESLFGPKGPWSYSKLQDKLPKMRFAREIGNELLKSQLQDIPNVMENEFGDPKVSFAVRMFGNDLKYVTYNGYEEMKEAVDHLNPIHYFQRFISKKEIDFHKAMMFLDSKYSIPTGAGLPLSLSAVGTSSITMKLSGDLKAENFSKKKELDLQTDIKPTISLDLTGSLEVDAHFAKTGLKVKTSMYSSTAVEGKVSVRGFKLAKVHISIPQQRSEIFNSRSDLLVLHHGKEVKQHGLKEYVVTRSICSWPVLDKTIGIKSCLQYHFVNVTKMRHAPYFVLAGPAGFRIFIEKLDPKAKDFIFEYKWVDKGDTSAVAMTFDAPGSSLGRIVETDFSIDRQTKNLTLVIKTTSGTVVTRGNYKNTPDEKYIQLAVDFNNFKHFDTSLSLSRKQIPHGYEYFPKFYLGVNNERVVEIKGSINFVNKRGISQYHVDMKFQTKRVTAKMFGYISKKQVTIATQLRLLYKFPNAPEQGVDLAFSLANRSKRNFMDIQGSAKFESSSYPQYDFDSKVKLLRGHAHTEGDFNITFNHKDDPMRWTKFGLQVIDKSLDDGTRQINTVILFSKPAKNIDVNADFKYHSKGPNTNVDLIVDYARDKRFSTAIFWYHNKRPLLNFKMDLNVTVPNFHPMIANFKLDEKQSSHYDIGFNGTWFSSHSISANGVYVDKSTSRSYDYHAKLMVKSPSFQDVFCNLIYHRDKNALKLALKFDQNHTDYGLIIKHINHSPQDMSTFAELKYQNKIFSVLTTVHSGDHQHVSVDIHLDQMREIEFAAWAHNKVSYKAAGIELKWDANRDPNQKLVLSGNYTKVAPFNYIANLLASYPGRTLLGNYEFVLKYGHLNTLVGLSWDDDQSFAVILNSDFNFDKHKYFVADSEIVTPFENWKQTFINAGFEHNVNMYSLNGSIKWEKKQHIIVDLFGNYTINDDVIDCEFRSILSSTLKNIPSLSATLAHAQNDTKVDTLLRLQYAPEDVIDIKSKWEVEADEITKNYTGTVVTSTPFSGFNKGYLISKVMITKDRYLRGVADLDFDFKKFSISAEGRLKRLTNSMLTVNITTPIEKYSTITGKFGFIEDQRYLVAMVTYPSKIMGVEVLLSVQSLTEFDTKFILGTPLDVLQRVIVIGKLKPECADFRVGWNSLLGGFTGKWHYANRLDFEYSYIIYTPLEGFEESSVVLKVIVKEGIDVETSAKLSGQKLGVVIFGETKPALLKELGIRLDEIYGKKNRTGALSSKEKEEYDDDDLMTWSGLVEIDTLINPTIKGTLDIDQKGPVYTIKSKMIMPDGLAVINDRLEFYGPLMMKNKLQITTPYRSFKQINSNYEMDISPGQNYILSMSLSYQNDSELVHNELTAKYIILRGNTNLDKTHNVTLHTETPAVAFLNIDGGGVLRIQSTNVDRRYSGNIYLIASSMDIASEAELKINRSAIYGDLYLRAKTASIYVPPVYLKYMRKTLINDEQVELRLNIPEIFKSEIYMHADWSYLSIRKFNVFLNVQTPFDGFERSIVGVQVAPKADAQTGNIIIDISPVEAIINNTFKNDVFTSVAQMKVNGNSIPVVLQCNIIKSTPMSRTLEGTLLIGKKEFNISGNIDVINNLPMGIHIEFIPKEGSDVAIIDYKIKSSEDSKYQFIGSAKNTKTYFNLNVDTKVLSVVDWDANAKLETSMPHYKTFTLDATCRKEGDIKTLKLQAQSPIKKVEYLKLGASIKNTKEDNDVKGNFEIPSMNGSLHVNWLWIYLENMRIDLTSHFNTEAKEKSTNFNGHYFNPNKDFKELRVGANVDLDRKWTTGSNITLILPNVQNVTVDGALKLPTGEVHFANGKVMYTTPIDHVEFLAKYKTLLSRKNYAVNGTAHLKPEGDNNRIRGNLGVEWTPTKGINNIIDFAEVKDGYHLIYMLSTPKYKNKKALVFDGSYKTSDMYLDLRCQLFKPEANSVAFGQIHFKELANMDGLVNITIPYENLNFAALKFNTETSARVYNRYLEAFWPDNSAKIDAKCDITTGPTLLHRTRKGSVIIVVPIASKHRADIDFVYQELPLHSVGNASVNYNGHKIMDGIYDCKSESKAGFEEDNTHVEIINSFIPIGVDYIHGYEYGAPTDEGLVAPSKDTKNIKLYHLRNHSKFAIEGDLVLGTTATGQQLGVEVKHLNKTVKFRSDYDILDQEYRQHSRLELAPATWIEYNVNLRNETVDQDFNAQRLQVDVKYPLRNFTAIGSYKIGEEKIYTDVKLEWDVDQKSIEAGLDWKKVSDKHEQLLLTLRHPTFEKDVTLLSEYEYGDSRIVDARVKLDYSVDTEQTFVMSARVDDNSKNNVYNYSYYIYANHNATSLDLHGRGDIFWRPDVYSTSHYKEYQRSYLPPQPSEALMRLDLIRNLIELKRESLGQLSYLQASYETNHPKYTGNLSITHDYNDAIGDYYLNLDEKIFHLDYNMTTDGRQSLHMFGDIPDARNAKFNIWRDYDDIRIMDVMYYLKMNHSRLIISNLIWRPELLRDLQSGFHGGLHNVYNYVIENINDTRHYVRSEIKEAISGIWMEAEPHLQNYLNDMRDLRLIEEDIEHFKLFLNRSYHANDFYIKTIVGFTSYAFDELALKKHFESVPAIISEIWGIMGESGKKIQKSIEWVIEKIKTYYKNITVFTRQLLDGDPIQHLSDAFSNILEQYDDFIRKLHVAFIQYIEKLWHQTYNLVIENWHRMLIAIEPTFLKLVAYTESIAWSTSQEFLDFLYIRKNEILESPYFAKFTNFTHDVDKFYKDITGNNTLSSVVKYTKISWNFFRAKYMDKLPFAKELEAIIREIVEDLNQLRKLPSVAFFEERLNQICNRLGWFYEYFDVETRLQNFLKLLHKKVTDYSQTALQAENRYRVPKTLFIFDPNRGKMQWEQKLPMSWHAFNETPNFHEIPEIKALYDVQSFFVSSHTNFWNFYYDYKPYTDPSEWFPPFKAQAMIIGTNHFVTFDKKFFDFKEDCSYLLASDMKDHNFTLVISYGQGVDSHELLLLVNKTVVRINIFTDVIKVGDSPRSQLPIEIDDTFIHRDSGMITVESSSGFLLECNIKFKVCTFEVSGWYFGKTAGLFGTINNEPSDDFLSSTKQRHNASNTSSFARSWALDKKCARSVAPFKPRRNDTNKQVAQLCDDLYSNKLSQFESCFERISKQPFLDMCMTSRTLEEACSSAAAYTTLCSSENTPLRMPDSCIMCHLPNGSLIYEGELARFTSQNTQPSADVVFLVESKRCNENVTSKNMKMLFDSLDAELEAKSFTGNRYSVVLFGGNGVFADPRVRSLNGKIFTNIQSVMHTLENIPVGNGSADIFSALIYASRLNFRPAVSKIFILMPCSECHEDSMKFDYPILHQLLSENDISLHILMNEDFTQKTRDNKVPYGIDSRRAYTKKDARSLKGDESLRNHIKLPKTTMGLCMPLALETNGTLFSTKYLRNGKDDSVKKFTSVFTKRVAEGAKKIDCVDCECTASNNGLSFMECSFCHSSRASIDDEFEEDELLMNLQPGENIF